MNNAAGRFLNDITLRRNVISMKQVTVISGKGGTGKTSIVAAIASIEKNAVVADCDVDAADLYLILHPDVKENHALEGGFRAEIDPDACNFCGDCEALCRYNAITNFEVDPLSCEGCGVCHDNCPVNAIRMERVIAGDWFVSGTRFGTMVHAKLGIAQENSGKLISKVRNRAKEIAREQNLDLIIIDGPPGIGCPVISSITGADLVLVVTEPTLSGLHDLKRVLDLTRHFDIRTAVCINKFDLNEDISNDIRDACSAGDGRFIGEIPYDPLVTQAMVSGKSLMENGNGPAAAGIEKLWVRAKELLV
jgi:MinD superfamily P-loop ATPase